MRREGNFVNGGNEENIKKKTEVANRKNEIYTC
jgi:hypothetical protein